MNAYQLFKAGKLTAAIQVLNAQLRDDPTDQRSRTFLFELLCFAGDFDSAKNQLAILEQEGNQELKRGVLVYKAAIHAEKVRQQMFEAKRFPKLLTNGNESAVSGKLNGREFAVLSDPDLRIGERLEVFIDGEYRWMPFQEIASVRVVPPKRLRDLLWISAEVTTAPAVGSRELKGLMIPSMAPLSWKHPDEEVRMGRVSMWGEDETGAVIPYGLKCVLVDGEEVPVVGIRELEIYPRQITVH